MIYHEYILPVIINWKYSQSYNKIEYTSSLFVVATDEGHVPEYSGGHVSRVYSGLFWQTLSQCWLPTVGHGCISFRQCPLEKVLMMAKVNNLGSWLLAACHCDPSFEDSCWNF